eukprot:CAMPEP_0119115846 /NCGR_PEP_ID=MMETSP1180-20130426/51963_1 /TAXON_ID=3052 ORGANISM="Chlamydomonas cf sp, Strain CCMP681" /NCGR_SAMPLE_ID=MMETSP1180 /ASSEMBLY_ACC=CAM_ASM_000741 /LENGTH=148 /DNA_ID=CAMNT_0007104945 /DNA_START=190 /DNA_END=636 /DNA_ORIENTATION=+
MGRSLQTILPPLPPPQTSKPSWVSWALSFALNKDKDFLVEELALNEQFRQALQVNAYWSRVQAASDEVYPGVYNEVCSLHLALIQRLYDSLELKKADLDDRKKHHKEEMEDAQRTASSGSFEKQCLSSSAVQEAEHNLPSRRKERQLA